MTRSFFLLDRAKMRRNSVPAFVQKMQRLHPELERVVLWDDFLRICEREEVIVRIVPLTRPARLVRYGRRVCIQLNKAISDRTLRTRYGMHELAHFWRDDPGEPCYYAEEEAVASRSEDFADVFAWLVTSPASNPLRDPQLEIHFP
ncbi:MAG: hypothetical protein JWO05_1127 [Gemmatimonadetes bacterium]|nr:hypothetical protein [Gemmatimonadota bacterium]